jgi:hypothetical protein
MQNSDGIKIKKGMWCQWRRMHSACTIDEWFEWPWQPLKGISIKNIFVPELSYPTNKRIYQFKGAN